MFSAGVCRVLTATLAHITTIHLHSMEGQITGISAVGLTESTESTG